MKTIIMLIALAALLITHSAHAAQQVTFYHHDALGSVIAKSNEQGQLYLNEEYQPYGEKVYGIEDTLGDSEDWYTGKNYSDELDLTYFGARWYDAKQGRFLSIDPVPVEFESPHTFNRYVYAKGNPYTYIDPDGENAVTAFGGLITETGKFITGEGFNGGAVYGALLDGYDGQGAGVAASAFQDATSVFAVTKLPGIAARGLQLLKGTGTARKGLGGNPFRGKTPKQVDKMLRDKGFDAKGPDPSAGRGSYINPRTGRKYYIDKGGSYKKGTELPHVDIHRPSSSSLPKKKLPLGDRLIE